MNLLLFSFCMYAMCVLFLILYLLKLCGNEKIKDGVVST